MALDKPDKVVFYLNSAIRELYFAHRLASETEGEKTNLIGNTRDMIYALTSALETLKSIIENGL